MTNNSKQHLAINEPIVAIHQNKAYVHRLKTPAQENQLTIPEYDYQLEKSEDNSLNSLTLNEQVRKINLEPEEVEIAVQATGLNFRDVLNAMGLYPGDPGSIRWRSGVVW